MAEGLDEVAAFRDAFVIDGESDEEAGLEGGEDGGEAVGLCPGVGIEISKDDDAVLGAVGFSEFVIFYFADGHGGESGAEKVTHILVLLFGDVFPSLSGVVESEVLLGVCLVPDILVVC